MVFRQKQRGLNWRLNEEGAACDLLRAGLPHWMKWPGISLGCYQRHGLQCSGDLAPWGCQFLFLFGESVGLGGYGFIAYCQWEGVPQKGGRHPIAGHVGRLWQWIRLDPRLPEGHWT